RARGGDLGGAAPGRSAAPVTTDDTEPANRFMVGCPRSAACGQGWAGSDTRPTTVSLVASASQRRGRTSRLVDLGRLLRCRRGGVLEPLRDEVQDAHPVYEDDRAAEPAARRQQHEADERERERAAADGAGGV